MGKRVDAVVVLSGLIFVVEFKVGEPQYNAAAIDQAVDYALDLKNFHAGSHERLLVPLVVATRADAADFNLVWGADGVAKPVLTNGVGLLQLLRKIVDETPKQAALDAVNPVEGEHQLFGFLTTEPNDVVGKIHPKAMPVILTKKHEIEQWMSAPAEDALKLQRPLTDGVLKIVATGERKDGSE